MHPRIVFVDSIRTVGVVLHLRIFAGRVDLLVPDGRVGVRGSVRVPHDAGPHPLKFGADVLWLGEVALDADEMKAYGPIPAVVAEAAAVVVKAEEKVKVIPLNE